MHLAFPQTSDWTDVSHQEALVVLSKYTGLYCPDYFHAYIHISCFPKERDYVFLMKNQLAKGGDKTDGGPASTFVFSTSLAR